MPLRSNELKRLISFEMPLMYLQEFYLYKYNFDMKVRQFGTSIGYFVGGSAYIISGK